MGAEASSQGDWRDAAAYAHLMRADRSLIAWEWLRRTSDYRRVAEGCDRGTSRAADVRAAAFGLVAFEPPHLAVPLARPLWRKEGHPWVLEAQIRPSGSQDRLSLDRLRNLVTILDGDEGAHLLLSDGFHTIRLDGTPGLFSDSKTSLSFRIDGFEGADRPILSLRRLLALARTGRFAASLHPPEIRARRWVLMLRAWDAMSAGANQRAIAEALLGRTRFTPDWRTHDPSARSQAQRLVRAARTFAEGGFRVLLA